MTSQVSKHPVVAKSIAVTRKLAMSHAAHKDTPIGPEFLALGILKAMADGGGQYLRHAGLANLIPCVASLPDASPSDLDRFPPVMLTDDLDRLLQGKLSGFKDGTLSANDALNILLAIPGMADRMAQLHAVRTKRLAIAELELMARVTGLLQNGYRLAMAYYSPDANTGMSDFVADKPPHAFIKAIDEYRKQRTSVRSLMYSGARGQELSVFERYMRAYGPITADVATAVVVNELTPYVCGGPLATVRDIAFAIAPDQYHRMVGKVIEAIQVLKKESLVRIFPEPDYCQMCSGVLPAEALISDFTQYLAGTEDAVESGLF